MRVWLLFMALQEGFIIVNSWIEYNSERDREVVYRSKGLKKYYTRPVKTLWLSFYLAATSGLSGSLTHKKKIVGLCNLRETHATRGPSGSAIKMLQTPGAWDVCFYRATSFDIRFILMVYGNVKIKLKHPLSHPPYTLYCSTSTFKAPSHLHLLIIGRS